MEIAINSPGTDICVTLVNNLHNLLQIIIITIVFKNLSNCLALKLIAAYMCTYVYVTGFGKTDHLLLFLSLISSANQPRASTYY